MLLDSGWSKLPVSNIHGDLVKQNIVLDTNDKIFLIDWEYCRTDIVTYDLWLYLFDQYGSDNVKEIPDVFWEFFRGALSVIGVKVDNLVELHLIHLEQRKLFVKNLNVSRLDS